MALSRISLKNFLFIQRTNETVLRFVTLFLFIFTLFFSTARTAHAQINTDNVTIMGRNALSLDDYLTAIHYFNQVIDAKPHLSSPYYYRAFAKFSLEDYNGAEHDCSTAIQLNPYVVEVYQLRGLCRIHIEDYQGAIDDYTRSLAEEPDDQGALYNRALCRLELKDFETADREVDLMLKKWKNFQRAFMVKAQICMELKDTVTAFQWIDSLIVLNPRHEQAWSFKGRYALSKKNYELADSCLTKAIEIQPSDFDNYLARAQARHALNQFDLALGDYDRTIEIIPEHFVAHYNRGLLRALVGDKNRAIQDFDFVIKIEPDNTLAIYNRALLREETGDYHGAISDYSALIKEYPNFTYGYWARAKCRRKIGDTRGAVNDETFVARAQLDMKFKPHQRRPIKEVRQRNDHSLDQYQQLVEEKPDSTHRFVNQLIGKVQNRHVEKEILPQFTLDFRHTGTSQQYHFEAFLPEVDRINKRGVCALPLSFAASVERKYSLDAVEEAARGMKPSAHAGDAHLLRSVAAAAGYDYDEALSEINQACHTDSLNYLYLLQRAQLYTSMERLEKAPIQEKKSELRPGNPPAQHLQLALNDLNTALQQAPKNAFILYNRGCLYARLQQYDQALKDFSAALVLDPHLAEARYNRAVIRLLLGDTEAAIPDLSRAGQDGLYKAYNLLKQANRLKADHRQEKKVQQKRKK